MFDKENEPTFVQVGDYIDSSLWHDLHNHLQQAHNIKPKLSYSSCNMEQGAWKGWNVKYQKSSKSLCTLYPKQGYLLLLVPIGLAQMDEAEMLMPLCSEYTQKIFKQTTAGRTGKSLAFEVKSEEILQDVKNLITIRVK